MKKQAVQNAIFCIRAENRERIAKGLIKYGIVEG